MADFIPSTDAAFNTFIPALTQAALANAALLKLSTEDQTALGDALNAWQTDYATHQTAQSAATAAASRKTNSRDAAEAVIRPLAAQWQANPAVTDALRKLLQLAIRRSKTTLNPQPSSHPVLSADTSQRLQITLAFLDARATSKAKPRGVRGCQIWLQTGGAAPSGLNGTTYLATGTRTPYKVAFSADDAGKTAHFVGRWENTRGETGPLSDVLSVIVPG